MFAFLHLLLEHIENSLKIAQTAAQKYTTLALEQLQSEKAIDAAKLVPEGEADREAIINLINAAKPVIESNYAAGKIQDAKVGLLQLGASLTSLLHGGHHSFGEYLAAFQNLFLHSQGKSE